MSRTGDCWDNAVSESFFSSLEYECIQGRVFEDQNDLQRVLFEYIENFYNTERFHSTIQMKSPIEFEIVFHSKQAAA